MVNCQLCASNLRQQVNLEDRVFGLSQTTLFVKFVDKQILNLIDSGVEKDNINTPKPSDGEFKELYLLVPVPKVCLSVDDLVGDVLRKGIQIRSNNMSSGC